MNETETFVSLKALEGRPAIQGPTVSLHRDGSRFEVTFGDKTFFEDPIKLMSGKTVGEMNREWLHERLDCAIDIHMKGYEAGPRL